MQKVFKRTILAERQAARRVLRRKEKNQREWLKTASVDQQARDRKESATKRAATIYRREDYELGPLKPKRDVGQWKDKFGTIDGQDMEGPEIHKIDREKRLEAWGGRHLNLAIMDRVVLLEGPDRGKIGHISKINKKTAQVTVEGLNRFDVSIPPFLIPPEQPDQRPIRTEVRPISIDSVRLVTPIENEGVTKDVIVKKLVHANMVRLPTGLFRWDRVIPGLDVKVPWPAKPKTEPTVKTDTPSDTLRIDVDVKSFIPTLVRPPIPLSVIDELRNKFSVFRTRHEPEYIAKKEAEEQEKEDRKKTIKAMRTPLMELKRKERKLRRAKGKGKLTPDMLERLGKAIAKANGLIAEKAAAEATPVPVAA